MNISMFFVILVSWMVVDDWSHARLARLSTLAILLSLECVSTQYKEPNGV